MNVIGLVPPAPPELKVTELVVVPLPPPGGVAHVPSALRKPVVFPRVAGTSPLFVLENKSSKVVACVPVRVSTFPFAAVTLPKIDPVGT